MANTTYANSDIKPRIADKVRIYDEDLWPRFIVEDVWIDSLDDCVLEVMCYKSNGSSYFKEGQSYSRDAQYFYLDGCDNLQLCMFQFD